MIPRCTGFTAERLQNIVLDENFSGDELVVAVNATRESYFLALDSKLQ